MSRGKIPLTIKNVVGESNLIYREEGVRWGIFMGAFVASHEFFRGCLAHLRNWIHPDCESQDWINSFVAGVLSGPWLVVLPANRQEFLSLYAPARMVSAIWTWFVKRGHVRAIPLGSSLLFALSSSQIMYAYVMHPESLLPSYWRFIVRSGPLSAETLALVKEYQRKPLASAVAKLGHKEGTTPALAQALKSFLENRQNRHCLHSGVPCEILHPGRSCPQQWGYTFRSGWNLAFPLYLSLSLTSTTVFNFRRFIRSPVATAWKILLSSTRSAVFLSAFPTFYMGGVCLMKSYFTWIPFHRFFFWVVGMIGSTSILLEKEHRRFELAMFALPRGVESAVNIMVDRGALPNIPYARVGIFALSMGVIMAAFDTERDLLVPAMQSLLSSFFPILPKIKTRIYNNKKIVDKLDVEVTKNHNGCHASGPLSDAGVRGCRKTENSPGIRVGKQRQTSGLYRSTSEVFIAARPHEVLLQEIDEEVRKEEEEEDA